MPSEVSFARSRSLAFLSLLVCCFLAGCSISSDDEAPRQQAAEELAVALKLLPWPSDQPVTVERAKSKFAPATFAAGGLLAVSTQQEAVDVVIAALEAEGWTVRESAATRSFLGWQVRALKGDAVADVSAGPGSTGPNVAPAYAPVPGQMHVSFSVGKRNSEQSWTQLD